MKKPDYDFWADIIFFAVTGLSFGNWQDNFSAGVFCFFALMFIDWQVSKLGGTE